jgi:hypothetical protein
MKTTNTWGLYLKNTLMESGSYEDILNSAQFAYEETGMCHEVREIK